MSPGIGTDRRGPGFRLLRAVLAHARLADRMWQIGMLTLSVVALILTVRGLTFEGDFSGDLYLAGVRIMHGTVPYEPGALAHQAAVISAGGVFHVRAYPRWPMPILVAMTPLSLLPHALADVIFMLVSVASVLLGLRLLDVRDPRCLLVALVSAPTVIGIMLGNLSPLLLLGAAVIWRLRDRKRGSAAATAAVVVSKLLFWPLGIWLLMTRGRRALYWAAGLSALLILIGWATIGFADLLAYPRMLTNIMRIGEGRGDSVVGFLMFCGLPVDVARLGAAVAGAGLLSLAWSLSRRPGCTHNAYGLVVMAALVMTPVVWSHYLVLLFVPIALLSPRLSPLWFLPSLAAFTPTGADHTYGLWSLPILSAQLALVALLSRPLISDLERLRPVRQWRRAIVATARAAAPS